MPGFVLHVSALIQCTHQAKGQIASPAQTRVKINGKFVAISTDVINVSSCPFQVPIGTGSKPQPCVTIKWTNLSTRVKIMQQSVLLSDSPGGICQSAEQIPQGPPTVNEPPTKVNAI